MILTGMHILAESVMQHMHNLRKESYMERYNSYALDKLTDGAKKALQEVLAEMGYSGRYTISDPYLFINSNRPVVIKAFKKAEEAAHGCKGNLVRVKKVTEIDVWVPEFEAETIDLAYSKAIQKVKNNEIPAKNSYIEVYNERNDYWYNELDV